MRFGPLITPEGVQFRLWAPAAQEVSLVLPDSEKPMRQAEGGWFEALEPDAGAGTRYRFRVDKKNLVPDPASCFQPEDVDGPSEVIDGEFDWHEWNGRPWEEAVIYELHVGTFTPKGDFLSVIEKIPHLKDLGITAIELMPLADFSGRRNWGYDGVLPYAPDSAYGRPEDLKSLVNAAHRAGLMVFLDVVYNHFGPKGNFLHQYAPQFFTERHKTPWGAAIDFSRREVRDFFIENARYWLQEYRFDGLRFDAVHAIVDDSPHHILDEIRNSVPPEKHLVLENDANQARYLESYAAQWNDDSHHAFHVLASGEAHGYYAAYAGSPARHLARCLAEGFAYQGEFSPFSHAPRGEPSGHLPPTAFVDFLQNHDQIGNRAFGERLVTLTDDEQLRVLTAILLLAPSIPLLFMGEEWGSRQPFQFFCDFPGELGKAVRAGRRREFPHIESMPDPTAEGTFRQCVLDWHDARTRNGKEWLAFYRELLHLRREKVVPLNARGGTYRMHGERAFEVNWDRLALLANCGDQPVSAAPPGGKLLWASGGPGEPWSAGWWLR